MLAAFVFAVLFALLSLCVFNDAAFVLAFDAEREKWFGFARTPKWSAFFSAITFFGGVYGVGLVCAALAVFSGWDKHLIELGVVAVGGSALVAQLVKVLMARVRPDKLPWMKDKVEYSYPSGHSTSALSLYGLLAILMLPASGIAILFVVACVLLILAIGASRVALSVHHASDIAGGYLLAASFLCLAFALFG